MSTDGTDDDDGNSAESYDRLRRSAVDALRAAHGDLRAIRAAVTAYLRRGYSTNFTPSELTDYFCVDTPSILDDAAYDASEADEVVAIFDEIHASFYREFGQQRKPT